MPLKSFADLCLQGRGSVSESIIVGDSDSYLFWKYLTYNANPVLVIVSSIIKNTSIHIPIHVYCCFH